MKNNVFWFIQLVWLIAGLAAGLMAQESSVTWPNGITVAITTDRISGSGDTFSLSNGITGASDSGNPMHRVIRDSKSMRYFGYDLSVSREKDSLLFRVSINPLSIDPGKMLEVSGYTEIPFPKLQEAILVKDGDTIELEVLRNPTSGAKVIDLIKITTERIPFGTSFPERRPAKDFTFEDVEMRIDEVEIKIGEERFKTSSSASGQLVWVYIKDKGRFIFSFTPQPSYNFNKTGTILNNLIEFEHDGVKYQFKGKSLVMSSSGKWNLWVMIDRDYVSKAPFFARNRPPSTEPVIEVGAASDAEWLFK